MILIKKSKSEHLVLSKLDKKIIFILLDKIFDYLSCIEEDIILWSLEIKDWVSKVSRDIYIWIQDKYTEFIEKLNRPEMKNKVFIRLANIKNDKEDEDSGAQTLSSNSKVFILFFLSIYIKYLIK